MFLGGKWNGETPFGMQFDILAIQKLKYVSKLQWEKADDSQSM